MPPRPLQLPGVRLCSGYPKSFFADINILTFRFQFKTDNMRGVIIIRNLLLIAFLFSCNKNESNVSNNPAVPSNLLVKIVSKSGNDSVVTEYSYDTGKRLVLEKETSVTSGATEKRSLKIFRDNSGIVTQTTEIADYLIASGVDSLVTLFANAAGRYTSSVLNMTQGATTVQDSVYYLYDGAGRIIRDQHFQKVSGVPFTQIFKREYIYSSAGNIDSVRESDFSGGVYTLSYSEAYTYDSKLNPLQLQNDAVILYLYGLQGANNATKTQANFYNPSSNNSINVVYTYRSDNRPSTSISTKLPSGKVSNETYFYQ